jgi:hypothetical protein
MNSATYVVRSGSVALAQNQTITTVTAQLLGRVIITYVTFDVSTARLATVAVPITFASSTVATCAGLQTAGLAFFDRGKNSVGLETSDTHQVNFIHPLQFEY